jgi:hypothetical protein
MGGGRNAVAAPGYFRPTRHWLDRGEVEHLLGGLPKRQAKEKQAMGWASHYIEKLGAGETVSFRPRGNSMTGKIESGQLCTVAPVEHGSLKTGDIVLCKVRGNEYLHLVKAIQGERFQIGNNRGRINGWISKNAIFGLCTKIED